MDCARVPGLQVCRIQGLRVVETSYRARLPLTFEHCTVRCAVPGVLPCMWYCSSTVCDGLARSHSGFRLADMILRRLRTGPGGSERGTISRGLHAYGYLFL